MGSDRTGPPVVDEHEAFMDLVAAYAVDAVDRAEEPVVEHHLDACWGCRRDLRRHHEILALVGATAPTTPPASVWRGIDEQTTASLVPAAGQPVRSFGIATARTARRPGRRVVLLVAAALVLLTGVFAAFAVSQRPREARPRDELAGSPVERAAADAQRDGRHREVAVASADGTLHGRILVDARGAGYFIPHDLVPLPPDRAYQLWGISSDGAAAQPVSLGVLGAAPTTSAFQASATDTTYAVTNEPAGGSQGPTTPVLASGTVT